MATRMAEQWTAFFKDAGIAESHRDKYAKTFADNEMDTSTATELTRDILAELGVTSIGHVLSILKFSREGDTKPSIPTATSKPSAKPSLKPPQLASDLTRPQFRKFKVDWGVYKSISGIEEGHIAAQIYSICDAHVQNSIINTHPDFFKESESEIMNLLEKLVTKSAKPTVHRMAFYGITQAENESMSDYLVRLNALAQDCEYTCPKCRHDLAPCSRSIYQGLKQREPPDRYPGEVKQTTRDRGRCETRPGPRSGHSRPVESTRVFNKLRSCSVSGPVQERKQPTQQ